MPVTIPSRRGARVRSPFLPAAAAAAAVLSGGCASPGTRAGISLALPQVGAIAPDAVVTRIEESDGADMYLGPTGLHELTYAGLQKRPTLRPVGGGRTLKGRQADAALGGMSRLTASASGLDRFDGGVCSGDGPSCRYHEGSGSIFVFGDRGGLQEQIELTKATRADAGRMRELLGDEQFVATHTRQLERAVRADDIEAETDLLAMLGDDVDLERLYGLRKLDRHRDLYLAELRSAGTYEGARDAYRVSGDASDLDDAFDRRAGHLDDFITVLDGNGPHRTNGRAAALRRYDAAEDVRASREDTRQRIVAERAREAEEQRRKRELQEAVAQRKREETRRKEEVDRRRRAALADRRDEFQRNVGMGDIAYVCRGSSWLDVTSWFRGGPEAITVRVESNGGSEMLVRFFERTMGYEEGDTRVFPRSALMPDDNCDDVERLDAR